MQTISGPKLDQVKPYFKVAVRFARQGKCEYSKNAAIIIKQDIMLGNGFNGPVSAKETHRSDESFAIGSAPHTDQSCCVHAVWRAILDAAKRHGDKIVGARLYYAEVDEAGNRLDAGQPACSVCSRLLVESGIGEIAIWNNATVEIYSAAEYDLAAHRASQPDHSV